MLDIKSIYARYGNSKIDVLDNVSIHVGENEIVSVVGANGAGKSTMINTISGLLKPHAGSIEFLGKTLPSNPAKVTAAGVIQVPEGRRVFAPLSVEENLIMGGYLVPKRVAQSTIDECYALFPILKKRKKQPAGTLSGGEQQMLAISRALVAQPKILLLDEPSLGLAPLIVKEIFAFLQDFSREKKIPLLMVEQNVKLALGISDRAYVMELGKITLTGASDEIRDNPEVKRAYLGG